MKDAPGQAQDRPIDLPKKAPAPPPPAPKAVHVTGKIFSVDGKLETRNYLSRYEHG